MAEVFDADLKRCWVDHVPFGFGMTMYACFSRNFIGPVALVWGFHVGKRFDVLHSYTLPFARRQGIRSLINDHILKQGTATVISTMEGTKDGGAAFLRKYGYAHHAESHTWWFAKERPRQAKRRKR